MAYAIKRIGMSRSKPFQDRCMYFMFAQADVIFGQTTPSVRSSVLNARMGNTNVIEYVDSKRPGETGGIDIRRNDK